MSFGWVQLFSKHFYSASLNVAKLAKFRSCTALLKYLFIINRRIEMSTKLLIMEVAKSD